MELIRDKSENQFNFITSNQSFYDSLILEDKQNVS